MKKNFAFVLLFSLVSHFNSLFAQTGEVLPVVLQQEMVEELAKLIKYEYVIEDVGMSMSARLDSIKETLNQQKNSEEFIAFINQQLRSVYFDKHLGVVNKEKYGQFARMFGLDSDDHGKPQEHSKPEPAGSHDGGHGPGPDSGNGNELAGSRVINRDGRTNIGLLKIDRFDGSARGVENMSRVLSSFVETDVIIIDLRNCRGGDADMVKVLSGYFFNEDTYLASTVGRKNEEGRRTISERWSLANDLSPIFSKKPLYIMTSSSTFSAAESFVFGLKLNGRITIVGENTGGGGHMNTFFPLPGGYGVSISVGRTYDKNTGEGFQGQGVEPEVKTEANHAFAKTLEIIDQKRTKELAYNESKETVHKVLQKLSESWYQGDFETASTLFFDDFTAYVSTNNDQVKGEVDLLKLIKEGVGSKTPREVRNREISIYEVRDNQTAIARLMLRDQIHYLNLINDKGSWKIISDLITMKERHG